MKKLLVATMALATLAGSATTALAGNHVQSPRTEKGAGDCASWAAGLNLEQSAAPLSATSIRLSWNDWCSSEDEFHILRSATTGGTFAQVGARAKGDDSEGEALSYDDANLTCETTYYYKLEPHKHGPNAPSSPSSLSAEFSATTDGCDEGKPAQAIANAHLKPGSDAAVQCETVLGDNWHGDVLSAAHVEFGTEKFGDEPLRDESTVTDWIDDEICVE